MSNKLNSLSSLSSLVASFDSVDSDVVLELKRIKNIKDSSKPVFRNRTGKIFHLDGSDNNPILCGINEIMTVFVVKDLDNFGFCITKLSNKPVMKFIDYIDKLTYDDVSDMFYEEHTYKALNYYASMYDIDRSLNNVLPSLLAITDDIDPMDENRRECNLWIQEMLPVLTDMFKNFSTTYGTPEHNEVVDVFVPKDEVKQMVYNHTDTQIETLKKTIESLKEQDIDTSGLESALHALECNIKTKKKVRIITEKLRIDTTYVIELNGKKSLVSTNGHNQLIDNTGGVIELGYIEDLYELKSIFN